MNVTLNNEQKLFVISSGNSVSCLGFQVVFDQACELVRRLQATAEKTRLAKGMSALLDLVMPQSDGIGTLEQYAQYRALLSSYRCLDDKATWFDGRTPRKVQRALEDARQSGDRMRVFMGDPTTGRDWLEEFDTIGTIGRSCGPMKSPLLVPAGDCGGPALLTDCIVRLVNLTTGQENYRHPKYHTPTLKLEPAASYDQASGYTHCVKAANKDGELETHANFKSLEDAAHWLAFISGKSHDYHCDE